jgi:hypothetical protein
LVNGSAVEVETTVSMDFAIKNAASSAGTSGGASPSVPPSSLPTQTNSLPNAATAPCTLGNVAFQENGAIIVGTVPFTYSGNAKLPTLAVVGFPVGADKKRIAGVKLAETTLQSASGNASFSMQSNPSLSGGGATGEYVEVVMIVKATGEPLCGKLVPYLRNW